MSPRLKIVSLGLLVASVVMMGGAWGFQSEAAGNLEKAQMLGGREVEEGGPGGEVIADYRAVLDSLTYSIELRSEIDAMLTDVEGIIVRLQQRSEAAQATADASRSELELIGRTLGGAVGAARSTFSDLGALDDALTVSSRLAVLIAVELAELDDKLGPGAP